MLAEVSWIDATTVTDPRGNLTVFEEKTGQIPFTIKRVYFLHGVPEFAERAGHGHKKLLQAFICLRGSVKLTLWDGAKEDVYRLDNPNKALVIPNGLWRDLTEFSPDTMLLVLASELYSEEDYMRSKSEFKEWVNDK
jgi:dTDP-4-dehydrorhamnose 3,5-epimerase-like enzyme